jgi:uncharacterized membrane protein
MWRNLLWMILSLFAFPFGLNGDSAQSPPKYTSIDVPGSASTSAFGINGAGALVGTYTDTSGKRYGFLLSGDTFTTIAYAGAVATDARGINNLGDIVGAYVMDPKQPGGGFHGFLWQRGSFTTIDYGGHLNTVPFRIAEGGQIVGCYHESDQLGTMRGFMLNRGQFRDLTLPASMNYGLTPDASIIVGRSTDLASGREHGYVWSGGTVAPVDVPFSSSTATMDINSSGDIVGTYTDVTNKVHGFRLTQRDFRTRDEIGSRDGTLAAYTFVAIDFPGATRTTAHGINDSGDIVGSYVDSGGKTHGYLLTRLGRR